MSSADLKANRPLSPHIQIYHWYLTMAMSIAHRATGVALFFGTLLLAWWLIAAASGPTYFHFVNAIFGSWFGLIVLFLASWALIHHTVSGLRHFVMDFGYGMTKPARDRLALAVVVGSAVLTVLVWIIGLLLG